MNNYERKFMGGNYGRFGHGMQVPAPAHVEWASWSDFSGGLELRDNRHEIPENSSPNVLDIEISSRDELHRAPGVLSVEEFGVRNPSQVLLQASLDYTAEMVFLDPPFLGYRREGLTTWIDAGLQVTDEPYGYVNFGGTLIFSDGVGKAYQRQPESGTIEELLEAPPARSYANFAARAFAGNVFIDGKREPLGVMWSGTSSDPDDWFGAGGGFEILVGNQAHADKIVSMRPLGFDLLAIICRRSVWIASRTGIEDRPADFQMRAEGPGAITDKACSVLPGGVAYLSDGGVYLFDGNVPRLISEQINDELLPLDLSAIHDYATYYHPGTKKLYLFTPSATWILDTDKGRWLKRSLIARGATIFGIQLDQVTWEQMIGSWSEQTRRWGEFAQAQTDTYDLYVLTAKADGSPVLGRESDIATENIDIAMSPTWEFMMAQGEFMNQLGTFNMILLEYSGAGSVQFWLPDINGHYQAVVERAIASPGADIPVVSNVPFQYTGMGLGLRLVFLTGFARVSKVQLGYVQRGPRIETGTFAPREYYEDFKG